MLVVIGGRGDANPVNGAEWMLASPTTSGSPYMFVSPTRLHTGLCWTEAHSPPSLQWIQRCGLHMGRLGR